MKKKEMFNEHGLSGYSGFSGEYGVKSDVLHVSANYGINENDEVFVDCYYDEFFEKFNNKETDFFIEQGWERMKAKDAVKNNYHIIKCNCCENPAVTLDHHYPYGIEMNKCKKHKN